MLEAMNQLYEEGGSDEEVMKLLRILPRDFEKKLRDDKDFKAFVEYGRSAAKAWWLALGRRAASTKGIAEYTFWSANMEHRYNWKKSNTVTIEDTQSDDMKVLQQEFNTRLGKMGRLLKTASSGEDVGLSESTRAG